MIADGLPVDDEADLGVVAKRVEKAISIGGHTARTIDDRLAQAPTGVDGGNLYQEGSISVNVSGWIDLQDVRSGPLHRDTGLGACQRQGGLDLNRHGTPDGHVLSENAETGSRDLQVVRVWRDIVESERSVRRCSGRLVIAADRIVDAHHSLGNRGAGRIDHRTVDGAGITQRLAEHSVGQTETKRTESKQSESSYHRV